MSDAVFTLNVPQVNATTFTNLTASLAGLKNLRLIAIEGPLFEGAMLPEAPVSPDQTTICDLVSSSVEDLELYSVRGLNGSIPECLFNSASRLRFLYIGAFSTLYRFTFTPNPFCFQGVFLHQHEGLAGRSLWSTTCVL